MLIYFVPNSNCSKQIFLLSSKLKLKMKSFLGSLSCKSNTKKSDKNLFGSERKTTEYKGDKLSNLDLMRLNKLPKLKECLPRSQN